MKLGDQYLVTDLTYTVIGVIGELVEVSIEDAYGKHLGSKMVNERTLLQWVPIPQKPKLRLV